MTTTTIEISDLPTNQFTAGALVKSGHARILEDAHAMLAPLVANGTLTKKTAGSGAVNYKLVKGAANAKKSGAARKATAKAAAKKSASSRTAGASTDRAERASLATAERKAIKEWEAAGSKGRRPATPNLDAISNGERTPRKAAAKKSAGSGAPRGTTVRFVIDGKPMPDSQNKLSSVAWQATSGLGADGARVDVKTLREIFTKAGVADPANTTGMNVTLANGKVITTTAL